MYSYGVELLYFILRIGFIENEFHHMWSLIVSSGWTAHDRTRREILPVERDRSMFVPDLCVGGWCLLLSITRLFCSIKSTISSLFWSSSSEYHNWECAFESMLITICSLSGRLIWIEDAGGKVLFLDELVNCDISF